MTLLDSGNIDADRIGGRFVVHVHGQLDHRVTGELRRFAGDADGDAVILDLSDVDLLDDAGLGALLGVIHRDREAGRVTIIAGAQPTVARMLRAAGAERLAAVLPTVEEALAESVPNRPDGASDQEPGSKPGARAHVSTS